MMPKNKKVKLEFKGGTLEKKPEKKEAWIVLAGFFLLLAIFGALLLGSDFLKPEKPKVEEPKVEVKEKFSGILNNSQIIDFRNDKLLFSDKDAKIYDFFLDADAIITKGGPPPIKAEKSDLKPRTRVNLVVDKDLITHIYIIGTI